MIRVLFVDDEPLVLQGLKRVLWSMSAEWEMAFAESGGQALELMAQAPFEVVVADMRMPVMNGAELLNEVMRRFPRTVRLILSGDADRDLLLKCVGSTHQCLSKPCDRETLKATIDRAAALNQTLQNEKLRVLASQIGHLPSLPSLYAQIVEKLQSLDTPLDEISAIVAKDIGMTAKLLKVVNSAFFGLHRQIADPQEAVGYLGVDTIKSLVLGVHAFSQFDTAKMAGFSSEELWRHSTQTAVAARAIAQAEIADSKVVDEAFGAGLLHDTGKLVLACNFGPAYSAARRLAEVKGLSMVAVERQVFGASHAEIGGFLMGLWGLPVPVVEAIALHHNPAQSPNRAFSPLTAVHVGDILANRASGRTQEQSGAQLDEAYLKNIGLAEHLDVWRRAVRGA